MRVYRLEEGLVLRNGVELQRISRRKLADQAAPCIDTYMRYLSISISISLSIYTCIHPCIHPSIHLSIHK